MEDAISYAVSQAGLQDLKGEQAEVLRQFASGRDVFTSLPTGYSKSYCYALLPALFDFLRSAVKPPPSKERNAITIVVSPLTDLMMEQRSI